MLHLAFDAKRLFTNFTGLGNYSRTLLRNLAEYYPEQTYFLFTPRVERNSETQYFLSSPAFDVHLPSARPAWYWRSRGVLGDLRRMGIDLYHGLSHEIPMGIQYTGIRSVVTIHDLIFRRYPEQYPWLDRQVYDFKFGYACRHADHVIAISESTRQDVMEFYGVPAERITVIYQSCSERFLHKRSQKTIEEVQRRYQLPADYLLYVGSLIERKNLLGILQAYTHLEPRDRLPLVIVGGGRNAYREQVIDFAREHGLAELLYFVLPDFDDLPALYQQARLFLYPSYYEGFGIPVIEALFSGTPVLTSRTSSLPEAAGPDAWLVDPARPAEIAEGIHTILHDADLRRRMINGGFNYAQRFLGEPLTHQLMELYRKILD